jgi:hypothetical protein
MAKVLDGLSIFDRAGQAVVGRVKAWLQEPQGRLPVSCTVYALSGEWDDVLASWLFVSKALRFGAGCAVNLEALHQFPTPSAGEIGFYLAEDHADYPEYAKLLHNCDADAAAWSARVKVADTMDEPVDEGWFSIQDSWVEVARRLQGGERVVVDLSRLRPRGQRNGKGLVASGPVSFSLIYLAIARLMADPSIPNLCAVYSVINEVLRRGGTYRNGAVTLFLDHTHPAAPAYLAMPRTQIEWAKRAMVIDASVLQHPLLPALLEAVESGDLFLAKKVYTPQGERLYSQVCMEVLLRSRDTCTLHHINIAELEIEQIPEAFEIGMHFLCELHRQSQVDSLGCYLPAEESRQVGLGILGLANFLAIQGITYDTFVNAFERFLDRWASIPEEQQLASLAAIAPAETDVANRAVLFLALGYLRSAKIARNYGMERAFTIAPTATSSFHYRDAHGYVTAPNIAPPIALSVLRDSQEFGLWEADYHPYAETAAQVGFDVYFRLACCFQRLMNSTGLAHAISFDLWDQQPIDVQFLSRWLDSPLLTTYYRTPTLGLDVVDKSRILCDVRPGECQTCAA